MLSHVTVGSSDLARAGAFYDAILIPLGFRRRQVDPDGGPNSLCWEGKERLPRFYVYEPFDGHAAVAGNGAMLAFLAPDRAQVERAYAAGLQAGGTCDGPPGERPRYGQGYFGAYLKDPDGNKIHLVFRGDLEVPSTSEDDPPPS